MKYLIDTLIAKLKESGEVTYSDYFPCECYSLEHLMQITILFDNEFKYSNIQFNLQLNTNLPFLRRVWASLKYIFKFSNNTYSWSETLLRKEDVSKLRVMLDIYDRLNEENNK